MDLTALLWIILITIVGFIFNYFLNRAPGSDPDDFLISIGPMDTGITCDCFLNTLIISTITTIMLILSPGLFESTSELLYSAAASFLIVWIAGIIGRIRRHSEWKELDEVVRRSVHAPSIEDLDEEWIDITFDDDEEF